MKKSKEVTAATALTVLERDGWSCVCCGRNISGGTRGVDYSIHHRIPRGMGGSRDRRLSLPSNLVTLCGTGTERCHGAVESHRETARDRGLILWRSQNPADVAVDICIQRASMTEPAETWLFLLDNEGGKTAVDDA